MAASVCRSVSGVPLEQPAPRLVCQAPAADPKTLAALSALRPLDKLYRCWVDPGSAEPWEVPERLQLVRQIGSGSYGLVAGFLDAQTRRAVAVKRVGNAFRDVVDAKRVLREIHILQQLRHENIVGLVELFAPPGPEFENIYIVTEWVDTDLHKVIYSRQSLTAQHCQYFLYQILRAVAFLHSARVLHRDIKPSNILVDLNCDVKLCDFGLARLLPTQSPDDKGEKAKRDKAQTKAKGDSARPDEADGSSGGSDALTDYVVTRWYRAPEVMVGRGRYGTAADLWSVGCVFAEMLGRRALFAGRDSPDQMKQIVRVLGSPTEADLEWLPKRGRTLNARRFIDSLPPSPKRPLRVQRLAGAGTGGTGRTTVGAGREALERSSSSSECVD
eukprot:Selendium_serpulae@DN4954_c0_g1_i4.p1